MVRNSHNLPSPGRDFAAAGSAEIDLAELHPEDIASMDNIQLTQLLQQAVSEIRIYREKDLMSSFDKLSGLRNREYFDELGVKMFLQAEKKGSFTVIILDINGLKNINDKEEDHLTGDTLIAATAARIEHVFRHTDIVARIGGDEFGILVPNANVSDIEARLNALENRILIPLPDGRKINALFSYGTASYEGQKTFSEMYKEADKAMYKQKLEKKALGIRTEIYDDGESPPSTDFIVPNLG